MSSSEHNFSSILLLPSPAPKDEDDFKMEEIKLSEMQMFKFLMAQHA